MAPRPQPGARSGHGATERGAGETPGRELRGSLVWGGRAGSGPDSPALAGHGQSMRGQSANDSRPAAAEKLLGARARRSSPTGHVRRGTQIVYARARGAAPRAARPRPGLRARQGASAAGSGPPEVRAPPSARQGRRAKRGGRLRAAPSGRRRPGPRARSTGPQAAADGITPQGPLSPDRSGTGQLRLGAAATRAAHMGGHSRGRAAPAGLSAHGRPPLRCGRFARPLAPADVFPAMSWARRAAPDVGRPFRSHPVPAGRAGPGRTVGPPATPGHGTAGPWRTPAPKAR